jgi:hypothetical protein
MTKEEFTIYVQAILDMESEKGELSGSLKLIKEALNKVNQTQLQSLPSYPISPNLNKPWTSGTPTPYVAPHNPFLPDWTYRPEHQPYYTVYCTTNTTQK